MAMGVIRLFVSVARALQREPERAADDGLDELAAEYRDFAYIGSRRTLRNLVLEQAKAMRQRALHIQNEELAQLAEGHSDLARRLQRLRRADGENAASEWFGRQWQKDSGVFPDFVLAWDSEETFGNGALLELKDSKGDTIASFNSTIPTRLKSLDYVERLMGSRLITHAAVLRDYPHSTESDYISRLRRCFYLVRTRAGNTDNVRLSLVEGSFFETLPKDRLLEEVWDQVLAESGVPEEQRAAVVKRLKDLEQSEIARSRIIERASVKPRLRLMAEVHPEANIHGYEEIAFRTLNLVIKREAGYDAEWLQRRFVEDGYRNVLVRSEGDALRLELSLEGLQLHLKCFSITHKRNGEHWVIQWKLP